LDLEQHSPPRRMPGMRHLLAPVRPLNLEIARSGLKIIVD
jgi:hypothetical protein